MSIERERRRSTAHPEPIDQRIAGALNGSTLATEDLQALLRAIEDAIRSSHQIVVQERARALDPITSASDAEQAVARADSAELTCRRYATGLVRLRERLTEQLHSERCAAWNREADAVANRADAATKQLARYPELVAPLIALLRAIDEANKAVSDINGRAPDGVNRRVDKVALKWTQSLVLPDPDHPDRNLWPPPEVPFAVQYVNSMTWGGDPRYSPRWHEAQQARAEAIRDEQQRLAAYNEERAREQERLNDEQRAQSQRRRS
jgi:hypothetical protein